MPDSGFREDRRPNVILLMSDQHRADALGCMGNPIIQTPNFDRLAEGGVIFDNAFVQCPVCMASRGAIHTGRYPRSIRMRSMGLLPPTETTLAETFRRGGYATGMFGKLHLTPQEYTRRELGSEYPIIDAGTFLEPTGILSAATRAAVEDPFKRNFGFDVHAGIEDHLWGPYLDWLEERAPELVPVHCTENWSCFRDGAGYNRPPAKRLYGRQGDFFDSGIPPEMHPSAFIVERTLEFVRENTHRPFFAHCSFVDPHHPFNAPRTFNRLYEAAAMPVPRVPEQEDFYPPNLPAALAENIAGMQNYPDELWQGGLANYYGMVSHIDWCVGRLLDGLEETGAAENTLIVFTADHGEYIGDHRLLHKGSLLFDSEVRVPLIFHWPGNVRGGRRIRSLVQEIDIYPTVMSLLGLESHAGVQGEDLSSMIRDPDGGKVGGPGQAGGGDRAGGGSDRVYCELDQLPAASIAPAQMIRSAEWKLIYFANAREGMLFHLKEDPQEMRNLYHDPGYAGVKEELLLDLLDRLYNGKDPLPIRLGQA